MSTANATIAVNYDTSTSSMYLSLLSNIPADTVTASGINVSLLPQSTAENQFNLIFRPGSGVSAVTGISVTSVSSTSVSVTSRAGGGIASATCIYGSFQAPAPTANFTLSYRISSGKIVLHDPTIVFNPPSGGVIDTEQVPVAEEVLV